MYRLIIEVGSLMPALAGTSQEAPHL